MSVSAAEGIPMVLKILGDCGGKGEFSGKFGVVTTEDRFCDFGIEKLD